MFSHSAGIFLPSPEVPLVEDGQELGEMPRHDHPPPQLVMFANVPLNAEVMAQDEEKEMAELQNVTACEYTDSEDEGVMHYHYDDTETGEEQVMPAADGAVGKVTQTTETMPTDLSKKSSESPSKRKLDLARTPSAAAAAAVAAAAGTVDAARKKKKPFYCKPCHFQAECEEEFIQHIRIHSAKKLIAEKVRGGVSDDEATNQAREKSPDNSVKGVIQCERCGYNTNRYDHYVAHLRHHKNEGDEQRVFKCPICPYSTVSQYHWKKHLRNHFPSKLFTCDQCSYFSDRKNNYIQHIRTHTGMDTHAGGGLAALILTRVKGVPI